MSRAKHGETIKPWVSARVDCREGRFLQVGNSLMLSPKFHALSYGAQITYLCMALESGGQREFTFPRTAAEKYGIPRNSLTRYVDELKNSGFITVQSMANLRKANAYSFCFAWKQSESGT